MRLVKKWIQGVWIILVILLCVYLISLIGNTGNSGEIIMWLAIIFFFPYLVGKAFFWD